MQLDGQRIALREFRLDEVAALAAIHSDPLVMSYYAPEVATREHARKLVTLFVKWARERPRRNYQLAVVERATGALMGSCGVRCAGCTPGCGEFGIGIGSQWWSRGLAREAANLILEYAFAGLELDVIHGVTVSANERVAKLLQRLGFTVRGARRGDEWMRDKNWRSIDWVITRAAWDAASHGARRS